MEKEAFVRDRGVCLHIFGPSSSSNRKECEGNGEEVDGYPSGKGLFFLLRAPKLGNGKSLLSFFHCHLHSVKIGMKIGTEKEPVSSGLISL